MKTLHHQLLLATALATGLVVAAPLAIAPALAGPGTAAINPDTGKLHPGSDKKLSSSSQSREIPSTEQARTALMERASTDANLPSIGDSAGPVVPATDAMRTETRQGQTTAGGPQATNSGSDVAHNGSQGNTNNLIMILMQRTVPTSGQRPPAPAQTS